MTEELGKDHQQPSGETPPPSASRLVETEEQETGSPILRVGYRYPVWQDVYHILLTVRWSTFLASILLIYSAINLIFAGFYMWGEGNIAETRHGSFADAFYFSVQTMATIGYGKMHPQTDFANILVTMEAMIGTTSLALASALMFARLARPTARVLFSKVAVVSAYEGTPALMFRLVNKRHNQIIDAHISVTLLRSEVTVEGDTMLRFHDLSTIRNRNPVFALPWTVIHPIDAASPLAGSSAESLSAEQFEILVVLSGFDDTFSQQVHAWHSYLAEDIRWNVRFASVVGKSRHGRLRIDFRRFHQVRH